VTNIINLLKVIERNRRQGVASCKIFELGRVFNLSQNPDDAKYEHERDVLSLAVAGRWYVNDWQKPESIQTVIKLFGGVLSEIVVALGNVLTVKESNNPFLHPGRRASLYVGRIECGFYGVVHPELLESLGMSGDVLYAEFDVAALLRIMKQQATYNKTSDYPSIKKDVTVRVPLKMWANKVVSYIQAVGGADLVAVEMVDEFKKDDEEFKRITYRLVFQSFEKTLEHSVVDEAFNNIIDDLKEKHNLLLA